MKKTRSRNSAGGPKSTAKGPDSTVASFGDNGGLQNVNFYLERFFQEYVEVYLKKLTIKSYYSFGRNYVSPALGERDITTITCQDVTKIHKSLSNKPTTANRVLALCSKFFAWCEKEEIRPWGSNPARGVSKFQEKPILKYLSLSQLKTILDGLSKLESSGQINLLPATAIKLLILTGARKGEILGLKWSEIDFENAKAFLSDSKTGVKTLYLPDCALDLLKALPQDGDFVFPSRSASGRLADLQWQWQKLLKETPLSGRWRIHDLRHGFASVAVNLGGTLPFIGFLLGHKRAQTTERYAHVAEHPAKALLNQVAKILIPGPDQDEK
jgi:integrase